MAYGDNGRGGLLSAGGIISIIVGVGELIGGVLIAVVMGLGMAFYRPQIPYFPGGGMGLEDMLGMVSHLTSVVLIVGIVLAVLGIVAIVGGVSAIKRNSFGLSLAGAICALLPINFFGILAVIFVSLGRREFAVEEYEAEE